MGFEEVFREVAFTCARFMAFSAHALLFGVPAVLLLVLRPKFRLLGGEAWAEGRSRLASRLDGVTRAAIIGSTVATTAAIALQATLVAALNEGELSRPSFASVFATSFGQWHLFRYPVLVILAWLLIGKIRRRAMDLDQSPGRSWWTAWFVLSFGLLATSSFTGHAAVAQPRALGLVNDMVHMAAAGIWFAGIVILAVLLPDAWRGKDDEERLDLLGPVVVRFSKVAMVAIGIVAATGALNSFFNVGRLSDLVSTTYGMSLVFKILFFLAILGLGGINHFFLRKRLQRSAGKASSAQRLFRKTIAAELAVAIVIMGSTGWLAGQAKTRQTMDAGDVSSGSTP